MSRKKGTITGTRNLNGMGNMYYNKVTGRYEYKLITNGRLRMATGKTAKVVNERKNALTGIPKNAKKIRLYSWIEDTWLPQIKPYVKSTTHKQYADTWKAYIKPNIKNVPLSTVCEDDMRIIVAKMSERGLSANSMKQMRKVLKLSLYYAIPKYLIVNPAAGIKLPEVQKKPPKTLKPAEIAKMFTFLRTSRWYWPLRFMLVTGLRRGEFLALKWSDIDEVNKVITVSDNLTNDGIGTPKSNKPHYVAYSEAAKLCIESFKTHLREELNPAVHVNEPDIIFVGKDGIPLRPQSLNNVFRRLKNHTGIEASPHSMRHTFVYYSKNKLSLSELKDNLGHDETTATIDIYGDMLFNTKIVAGKIDDAFSGLSYQEDKKDGKIIDFSVMKNRAK
jgi:integrase